MYLHESKDFEEILNKTHEETGYETAIVEKDYYVSMMLKGLSKTGYDFIFKGGTSLSKAYGVINRFSEDIDLTVSERPPQSKRVSMADSIIEYAQKIGLTIINREKIRRRGYFNRFVFEYTPVVKRTIVMPQIIVECYVEILGFPTERKKINSFVGTVLNKYNRNVLNEYGLEPFEMSVQSIKRTLIDKVFALCDYYLAGEAEKHSRHIYDIYHVLQNMSIGEIDKELVACVREQRRENKRCLSADEDVDVVQVLREIVDNHYFAKDYKERTSALLFDDVSYDEAVRSIEQIINSELFVKNR